MPLTWRPAYYQELVGRRTHEVCCTSWPIPTAFTSPDTLIPEPGSPLAWDRYAYVKNNALKYIDPDGHNPFLTGLVGLAVGGAVGGITYFSTNLYTFDSKEYWTAVGAGAVSGALIGSGLGLLTATTTTAALATSASMMVGAGSASAVTEIDYMVEDQGDFESESFIESAAISGVVGGVSSICPMTSLGVAAKGLTYIGGAEVQYAVQTESWTVKGAQQAALYGTVGALFDVGVNSLLDSTFVTNGPLSNYFPQRSSSGYLVSNDVISTAAIGRAQAATAGTAGNFMSGFGAAVTNRYVRRNIME